MKSLLFLTVLILFTQCSIEKRVHNPGWHVTWKHQLRKSHANKVEQNVLSNQDTKKSFSIDKIEPQENSPTTDPAANTVTELLADSNYQVKKERINHTYSLTRSTEVNSPTQEINIVEKHIKASLKKQPGQAPRKTNPGVPVLIIGLILLILGIIALLAIDGEVLLGGLLFIVFGIAAIITGIGMFLVGLVITLVIYIERSKNNVKSTNDEHIDPPSPTLENDPTDEPSDEPQNTPVESPPKAVMNRRKATAIFAAVGLFLMGIYLLTH